MQSNTDRTPTTKRDSYQNIKETGEDEPLRRRVAAAIAEEPATTAELADRFPDKSNNAIRPRVNELVRMDCVVREGKRENPSGHDAYVHHLTERGTRFLEGEIDPEPSPPLSELQADIVDVARAYCSGEATKDELESAVALHDGTRMTRNPEWSPPTMLVQSDSPEPVATDGGGEVVEEYSPDLENDDIPDGLTEEEVEKIESDPVLELDDFREG